MTTSTSNSNHKKLNRQDPHYMLAAHMNMFTQHISRSTEIKNKNYIQIYRYILAFFTLFLVCVCMCFIFPLFLWMVMGGRLSDNREVQHKHYFNIQNLFCQILRELLDTEHANRYMFMYCKAVIRLLFCIISASFWNIRKGESCFYFL